MGMIRVGLMMHGKVLQIALIGIVSGKATYDLPD
jgi:hypothetical protein